MDRHRLAVVVEHDDFQEPAGPVGTNVGEGVALRRHAPSTAVAGHGCRVDATGRQELDKRRGSITATDDRR